MNAVPVPVADHGDIAGLPVLDHEIRLPGTFDLADVPVRMVAPATPCRTFLTTPTVRTPELEKSPAMGKSPGAPRSNVWSGPAGW